jgi:hypothetical protein
MDPNTELLLAKSRQLTRWEDEEKATNDVEQLREEFLRRLYGSGRAELAGDRRSGGGDTESRSTEHATDREMAD